jgi:stress-induced-phosphoprotein 1
MLDLGSALDDCNTAIKLDPEHGKAYNRRAGIEFLMKEYHKAMDDYQKALQLNAEDTESKDGLRRTVAKINEASSGEADPERAAHAMADPEIQAILRDPMVSQAIQDMQRDPASAQKVLRDPQMMPKIQVSRSACALSHQEMPLMMR